MLTVLRVKWTEGHMDVNWESSHMFRPLELWSLLSLSVWFGHGPELDQHSSEQEEYITEHIILNVVIFSTWNIILTIYNIHVFFVTYFFSLIPHSEIRFHFIIHVFCLNHLKQTDDERSEKQPRGLRPGSLFVSIKKISGHFCVYTIAFQYEACERFLIWCPYL